MGSPSKYLIQRYIFVADGRKLTPGSQGVDTSATSCVCLSADSLDNFTDTSEGEILTLATIFWLCWLLPSSMATIIMPNSSGGCTPQGTWSCKLIDIHLSCQNTSCAEGVYGTTSLQEKQREMDWPLVLAVCDLLVLLVFYASWLGNYRSRQQPFLWWLHLSPVLTFPKVLLIHCYAQIRYSLFIPKVNFAIVQPWTEKVETYAPLVPSFLSTRCLFSTLMNRRKSFFKLESGWSHIYFYIIVVSHLNYLIYISILIYMFLMITWSSICPPEVEVLGYFSLSQTQYERHKLSQCLISR